MSQKFNEEPFRRVGHLLDCIDSETSLDREFGIDRLDNDDQRIGTVDNTRNYLEQARRFLKGSEIYDSEKAYQLGEQSIDDMQQNLQILFHAYPEETAEAKKLIPRIWAEKKKVRDSLSSNPDPILDTEYRSVLMDCNYDKL